MSKIVFLGGNGLAIELYEYMKQDGIDIYGYYAPKADELSRWVTYLGDERDSYDIDASYVIASGLISLRSKLIRFIEEQKLTSYTYISSRAYISSLATIGRGSAILPNAVVSGDPVIGDYLFMNVAGQIAHQSVVGNNVVVGPGAIVTGNCKIEDNVALGTNVSLIPGTYIGRESEIGIGAVPKKRVKQGRYIMVPKSEVVDKELLNSKMI